MDIKKYVINLIIGWIVKKYIKGGNVNLKTGWKTTEFWLSIASILVSVFMALQGMIPAELVAKIVGAVAMIYAIARAVVKFTPSKTDDAFLAKLEELLKNAQPK